MPSDLKESKEAALGVGFVIIGFVALVSGLCCGNRGPLLTASVLSGLFLLAVGTYLVVLELRCGGTGVKAPAPAEAPSAGVCKPCAEGDAGAAEQDPAVVAKPSPPESPPPAVSAEPEAKTEAAEELPRPGAGKQRCSGTTKSGSQCKLMTEDPSGLCHLHRG